MWPGDMPRVCAIPGLSGLVYSHPATDRPCQPPPLFVRIKTGAGGRGLTSINRMTGPLPAVFHDQSLSLWSFRNSGSLARTASGLVMAGGVRVCVGRVSGRRREVLEVKVASWYPHPPDLGG